MLITPLWVLKNSSLPPGKLRRGNRSPTFGRGDRIVWDHRTMRLHYEAADGVLRGILSLVCHARDEQGKQDEVDLPGPSTFEQARALVFSHAAGLNKTLVQSTAPGQLIWTVE